MGSYAFQSKSACHGERIFNACCSKFTQPRGSVYVLGQRDTTVYNSPLRNPVRFACTVAFHAPVTLLLLLGRGCCVKYPTSFVGISAIKQPLGSMLGHVATFDESEKGPRVRKITVAVLVKRILLCAPCLAQGVFFKRGVWGRGGYGRTLLRSLSGVVMG